MPVLRVAVLIDLPREAASGGHVKYWERVAQAAVKQNAPIDLTLYFSGAGADEILSPHVRLRFLPPVFSTARLKFLPYVPAHTDLAPFHPRLARELPQYDVLHATDGFFAFARTAERIAKRRKIPLATSFHTDTPAYAELFTRQTLTGLLGKKFGGWLDSVMKISKRERASKDKRLADHLRVCSAVLAMRPEDIALAQSVAGADKIKPMRLGVDKDIFMPRPDARGAIEEEYQIAQRKFLVLFVGRVDAGKNVPLLIEACVQVLEKGIPLHLAVVGQGPLCDAVKTKLGEHATLTGLLPAEKLAQFYAAADCLAMTSDIEIGGLIGVEALACGCPVLTSKQSGVAQLCGETAAMRQVESREAAWADALACLAQDRGEQTAMREAALDFRRDKLAGWDDVLKEDFMPVWQALTKS
ncbi:MAG: glycosyltransferase [Alphaproteobacteria bacterium]|nr:glycosyltransferase [Alphaproteobacteria bacterium]